MHRSDINPALSTENTFVYKITFSIIKDGVESTLHTTMYMFSNANFDVIGYNALPNSEYTLEWKQMESHPYWINTLNVYKNAFIHKGENYLWFEGCKALGCEEPVIENGEPYWFDSQEALDKLRLLYDEANIDGKLEEGLNSFVLKTKSKAPVPKMKDGPKARKKTNYVTKKSKARKAAKTVISKPFGTFRFSRNGLA